MTISIEQHIDELRAELREVIDPTERCQIARELEEARAEFAVLVAEQDGKIDAEPPS